MTVHIENENPLIGDALGSYGFADSPLAHMVQQVSIHYTTVSEVIEATNKFLI